jgi:hypothetical protein
MFIFKCQSERFSVLKSVNNQFSGVDLKPINKETKRKIKHDQTVLSNFLSATHKHPLILLHSTSCCSLTNCD